MTRNTNKRSALEIGILILAFIEKGPLKTLIESVARQLQKVLTLHKTYPGL
jgi:hypothetical protein